MEDQSNVPVNFSQPTYDLIHFWLDLLTKLGADKKQQKAQLQNIRSSPIIAQHNNKTKIHNMLNGINIITNDIICEKHQPSLNSDKLHTTIF